MRFFERLHPAASLSHRDVMLGLRWVVRDGLFSQGMETLVIGPFLVAYALELGASNLMIGLLAAIPQLAQFNQIPGVYLIEKIRKRRLISVVTAGLSRPALLVMAAAAFIESSQAALTVLAVGFTVRYLLGAMAGVSWNAWMRDLIPQDLLGRFFANRLAMMTAFGAAVSILAGALVDLWREAWPGEVRYAFVVLLVLAFISGVICVYCIARIPEEQMPATTVEFRFLETLSRPFRDENFRRLILFLASWNFAINLAAPFFAVYLLDLLHLDLTLVIALTVLSQLTNVLVLRLWGRVADRFSNKSVLAVAAPLFILCIFAWTFTTMPDKHAFTLPLLVVIHALTGIATAGVTLASGNIGLKLAPKGEGAAYLAAASLATALAAAIAPIIGGAFADFFQARELSLTIHWVSPVSDVVIEAANLRHWDFFFLFATVLGLYSIHRLALVREVGEVDEHIVLHEILMETRRNVRAISTIAGLKQATEFPFSVLARTMRRRARRHGHARATERDHSADDPPAEDAGG